jgi:hypothetical protein
MDREEVTKTVEALMQHLTKVDRLQSYVENLDKLQAMQRTRLTCLEDDVKGLRGDLKELRGGLGDTVFSYEDCLLQPLPLPTKSPIRVMIRNGRVELRIGPHEWAWDMRTGELAERHILNLGHFPP